MGGKAIDSHSLFARLPKPPNGRTQLVCGRLEAPVQLSCSVVFDSLQPHGLQLARPPGPSPAPGCSLKLMSIESVMPSNHLILCRPLLLPASISPSIRVFADESVLPIRWPEYCSFSFNISPSNENSGLISFRMDWLDLLAVQGTEAPVTAPNADPYSVSKQISSSHANHLNFVLSTEIIIFLH